ncbi:AIPR family protein [Aestuariivivens sediminis]|uniref:AIPR family protein n=1 Tax=Aestuariivivens sediminis TaxID=2913557 RepID=UPI001F5906DB|nr:AIPR family protein [Aestuariivivens sediminis]
MKQEEYAFFPNYSSREDLAKYGDNALLLYTLQLKYSIEDIDEVATDSLVDGADDKKTDLVYIDLERSEAVIAQGFFSKKDRGEAPANKASDLNTAVSWLLTRQIEDLPDRIKSAARELRQKIEDDEITRITIWYSHNLPESENVRQELISVEHTLYSILSEHYSEKGIESHSLEVGLETLNEWYLGLTIPILMTDEIVINNCDGFSNNGTDWNSFSTSIHADILYELYQAHSTALFSANVRDYLGSRRSDSNINNGIKNTATETPKNFFVYNNGITALVNGFDYDAETKILKISGLSIVNGAQTTGAIGSLNEPPIESMLIPIRLIKCSNPDTVASIVKYNNSQNKINAPDFRSNDQHQKRITSEFGSIPQLEYTSRRGGSADIIRRNPNVLPSITAGQVIAAFHGEPSIAYNDKSKIWDSDRLYSKFFNDQTTAKHITLCYSLMKTIEELKIELLNTEEELMKDQEKNLLAFLRSRGSIVLFTTAISDCLENLINRRIANKFSVEFCRNISLDEAKILWRPIVNIGTSFVSQLNEGLQDGIKNQQRISAARTTFVSLMTAVRSANSEIVNAFAEEICNN